MQIRYTIVMFASAIALFLALPSTAYTAAQNQASPAVLYNVSINENEFYSQLFAFNWPIGTLDIVGSNLPFGSSLPYVQGTQHVETTFNWTPTYCQAGQYLFDILYRYDSIPAQIDTMNISVLNTNRNPTVQTAFIPDISPSPSPGSLPIRIGGEGFVSVDASDIDQIECSDDQVQFPLPLPVIQSGQVFGPTWWSCNAPSCLFEWDPVPQDWETDGTHTVTFTAQDQNGGQGQAVVPVTLYYCGDVNRDSNINGPKVTLGDVIYLVNHIFKGGQSSWPLNPKISADVNDDRAITLGDVIYLVNYIFKGGQAVWPLKCGITPPTLQSLGGSATFSVGSAIYKTSTYSIFPISASAVEAIAANKLVLSTNGKITEVYKTGRIPSNMALVVNGNNIGLVSTDGSAISAGSGNIFTVKVEGYNPTLKLVGAESVNNKAQKMIASVKSITGYTLE